MRLGPSAAILAGFLTAILGRGVSTATEAESEKVAPRISYDARKVDVGRKLFGNVALSLDSSVSCASCHRPDRAFTDTVPKAIGVGVLARRRNAPTLLDVDLYRGRFDWDGKAHTAREQIEHVFSEDGDMGWTISAATARVATDPQLSAQMHEAFGRDATEDGVVDAILAFQSTLTGGLSRFDRYYLESARSLLTAAEVRGWEVFRGGTAGCAGCHAALPEPRGRPMMVFRDNRFHNLGIGFDGHRFTDGGRGLVTGSEYDIGKYATPSLRHIAVTFPYMHDGSIPTLAEVVAFYERGGIENPRKDVAMRPFALSPQERADLVSFLCTLTGENAAAVQPDPSCK